MLPKKSNSAAFKKTYAPVGVLIMLSTVLCYTQQLSGQEADH